MRTTITGGAAIIGSVSLLAISGCGASESTDSSSASSSASIPVTTTSAIATSAIATPTLPPGPIDGPAFSDWIKEAESYAQPCLLPENVDTMFNEICRWGLTVAAKMVGDLKPRLDWTVYGPTLQVIDNLTGKMMRWRDQCIDTLPNTPQRQQCIAFVLVPADFMKLTMQYNYDTRHAGDLSDGP